MFFIVIFLVVTSYSYENQFHTVVQWYQRKYLCRGTFVGEVQPLLCDRNENEGNERFKFEHQLDDIYFISLEEDGRYLSSKPTGSENPWLVEFRDNKDTDRERWRVECVYGDPFYCYFKNVQGELDNSEYQYLICSADHCFLTESTGNSESRLYFEDMPHEFLPHLDSNRYVVRIPNEVEFMRYDCDCSTSLGDYNPNKYQSSYRAVGGNCYVGIEAHLPREDASTSCEEMGGNLVTINEYLTNNVVRELMSIFDDNYAWIGLSKVDGRWVWDDGSKNYFSNWGEGKPLYENDHYAVIDRSSGFWSDYPDTYTAPAVCFVQMNDETVPYIFSKQSYDTRNGELAVALHASCTKITDCGFVDNSLKSLIVPRGWQITLFQENNFGGVSQVFQGPVNVPKIAYSDASSYRTEQMEDLGIYPVVYEDPNFVSPLFYVTGDHPDVRYDFQLVNADNTISSLRVPRGFLVTLFAHPNFNAAGSGSVEIMGPKEIPDLEEYSSVLADSVTSLKLQSCTKGRTFVNKMYFDRAVVKDEETATLESLTITNPSGGEKSITMTQAYAFTSEDNWFNNREVHNTWNMEVGVSYTETVGAKVGAKVGPVSAEVSVEQSITSHFTSAYGGEFVETNGDGGSHATTQEKSYEYECSAQPYTYTTCDVFRTAGKYEVPYEGVTIWAYPNGETRREYFEDVVVTDSGSQARLIVSEISTKCVNGTIFNGLCYGAGVRGDEELGYTYLEAEMKCYEKGLGIVSNIQDVVTNRFVHEKLCDLNSFWMAGTSTSSGDVVWMKDNEEDNFERWLPEIDGNDKFGNEDLRIMLVESELGYWDLKATDSLADCFACVGPLMDN